MMGLELGARPIDHVYQYAVPVGSSTAYLWIPPSCSMVKGLIIALDNMLERKWLEGRVLRNTAAAEGLGIIWVGPPRDKKTPGINADMTGGSGDSLVAMLKRFADASGYKELAEAPLIPMGHSAHGQFAWTVAAWDPARVIAAIAVKTVPLPDTLAFTGVPVCYIVGQTTEWPEFRDGRPGDRDFFWPVVRKSALALRHKNEDNLVGVVVDPGGGHFDWSDRLARFLALYITHACAHRLPPHIHEGNEVRLPAETAASGWLSGSGGMHPDKYPPAPYGRYRGDGSQAYWWFDRQTAEAAADFEGDRRRREKQMVTFVQDGKVLPVAKTGFASLKFEPEEDGVTFQVKGGFLDEMPKELLGAGTGLHHADGPIHFYVISGPAIHTAPRTFRLRFDRGGPGPVWIEASQPGNQKYRHSVQPGRVSIPAVITKGKTQVIDFPAIADQQGAASYLLLKASSDRGLPVRYYVDAGPAYVTRDTLHFTPVPVHSRFPLKVTVVAYQWGRIVPPYFQTAEPVVRTFYIQGKNNRRFISVMSENP